MDSASNLSYLYQYDFINLYSNLYLLIYKDYSKSLKLYSERRAIAVVATCYHFL